MNEVKENPLNCFVMANGIAKETIEHIYHERGANEVLSDIELDKVLDAVKILEITKRNGVA